jgi:hypothetical protein
MSRGKPRVQKPTPVCWIHLSREQRRRLRCRPVLEDGAGAPSSAGRGVSRVRRELPLRQTWTAASEGTLPIPDLVATALDLRGEDQERQGGGWRLRAHSCCSQVGIDACRSADSQPAFYCSMRSGRCLSPDGSRCEGDVRDAAGGSGSPPAGDHADPASRRRVDDVGDLFERQPDGDTRSAAQAEGSPFDAQVNSRLRCCTCRILLLYWQQERPSPILVGASDAMKERGLLPLQRRLPA